MWSAVWFGGVVCGFLGVVVWLFVVHVWFGNVCEFENVVECVVVLVRDEWVGVDDLLLMFMFVVVLDVFGIVVEWLMMFEEFERGYVKHVFEWFGGNRTRVVVVFGVNWCMLQCWLGRVSWCVGGIGW